MNDFFRLLALRILIIVGVFCAIMLMLDDSQAGDTYVSGLLGVANTGKKSISESKLINVGYRQELGFGLTHQYELGGWEDHAGDGRKSSAYGAYQLGIQTSHYLVMRVMAGPALISTPDSYLGGNLQFTEDFYAGFQGDNFATIGVKYKHFSSGGLYQPNVGRDYMGAEVGIPF